MKRVRWLTSEGVRAVQVELIARYGGSAGLRDENLLESALARPRNIAAYQESPSLGQLAAAYAWGLIRNHAFVDGNKRIALAALVVFLELNGHELACSEVEETAMILRAAASEMTEPEWTSWVERNVRRKA